MLKRFFIIGFFIFISSDIAYSSQCINLFNKNIESNSSQYKFENGHNKPLQAAMIKVREYDLYIKEFVDSLTADQISSPYLNQKSYRNLESLNQTLTIANKYKRLFEVFVEKSETTMMTSRIEMIPVEKRSTFIARYKESYARYLELIEVLIRELESYRLKDPKSWDNKRARDILMEMHTVMGGAHNRF